MKRRRRDPLFNQPQNKNNPKKHHLPCALFNVIAELALLVCIKRLPTEKEVERDIDGAEVGGDD
eukprot:3282081-Ditylum_brightwellii.AAC.1